MFHTRPRVYDSHLDLESDGGVPFSPVRLEDRLDKTNVLSKLSAAGRNVHLNMARQPIFAQSRLHFKMLSGGKVFLSTCVLIVGQTKMKLVERVGA